MPDELLGIERATWDLDPDDSPTTDHSWRCTQSNTPGSTKKADDDDEPCGEFHNYTESNWSTTSRQSGGIGGKRTLCQTRCKDHHRHGAELRTNCAEGGDVETGREQL